MSMHETGERSATAPAGLPQAAAEAQATAAREEFPIVVIGTSAGGVPAFGIDAVDNGRGGRAGIASIAVLRRCVNRRDRGCAARAARDAGHRHGFVRDHPEQVAVHGGLDVAARVRRIVWDGFLAKRLHPGSE